MNDNTKEIEEEEPMNTIKIVKGEHPNIIKMAKEFGYKGNTNDPEACMKFVWQTLADDTKQKIRLKLEAEEKELEAREKELEAKEKELEAKEKAYLERERLKSINAYDKQLTTPKLEKIKRYSSRYKKPDTSFKEIEVIKDTLILDMEKYIKGGNLNLATTKLLEFALTEFTKKATNIIQFNIKEYLRHTSIDPTPSAIKYLKERIRTEYASSLGSLNLVEEKGNKKKGTWCRTQITIFKTVAYDKDNICIEFSSDFIKELKKQNLLKQHAKILYSLEEKDTNAYFIGDYLETYYGMTRNRISGQYNKIGVKSLLKICSNIPTEKEVKNSNTRNRKTRIIEPFEKALNTLTEIGFMTWKYVSNPSLKEEQQTQLKNKKIADYTLFKTLYINFTLLYFSKDLEPLKIEKKQT